MLTKVNDRLSELASRVFSSIYTAYSFLAFSLLPLLARAWMNPILYASNCIQLVALPLLGVTTAVQGNFQMKLIRETNDEVMAEHADTRADLNIIKAELADLKAAIKGLSR